MSSDWAPNPIYIYIYTTGPIIPTIVQIITYLKTPKFQLNLKNKKEEYISGKKAVYFYLQKKKS